MATNRATNSSHKQAFVFCLLCVLPLCSAFVFCLCVLPLCSAFVFCLCVLPLCLPLCSAFVFCLCVLPLCSAFVFCLCVLPLCCQVCGLSLMPWPLDCSRDRRAWSQFKIERVLSVRLRTKNERSTGLRGVRRNDLRPFSPKILRPSESQLDDCGPERSERAHGANGANEGAERARERSERSERVRVARESTIVELRLRGKFWG